MKKQIMLLAIVLSGIFSMQAQEKQDTLSQSKQTTVTQTRRVTDWSEQPIGYVYGGIGVGRGHNQHRTGLESRYVALL